jgi:hypothetical protein
MPFHELGQKNSICLPSIQPDSCSPTQSKSRDDEPCLSGSPCGQPSRGWPLLIAMLIDYPVYLRDNPGLLTDMSNPGSIHLLFPTLKLAVWEISGHISLQRAFQARLSSSWSKWNCWCDKRQSNPIFCPIEDILTFLADQYCEGKEYRTINVLR